MPDRSTAAYWLTRFTLGVALLIAAGTGLLVRLLRLPDPLGFLGLGLGVYGFLLALSAVGPLTRLIARHSQMRHQWSELARELFARASLPRRVYFLLAAVAESDGPMTVAELATVRSFVLARFAPAVDADEIASWQRQSVPLQDRTGLAARIALGLDDGELDTLFVWCCLVAFADGRFQVDEHSALQDIARGLGIPRPRARFLFHMARVQFLAGQRASDDSGSSQPGGGSGSRRSGAAPSAAGTESRRAALAVLGLPEHATREQIRRRHRELVRKFHPDAQPHLGPVAQREATERFTAIQRAYELLSS